MATMWTSAEEAQMQGFDSNYYLAAKAAQLTATTGQTWTVESTAAALQAAGLQPYQHYQQYGYTEGLAPNGYFNSNYYVTSKAAAAGVSTDDFLNAWSSVSGGASVFFHYIEYGAYENNVNPASSFDDQQYYIEKANQLNDGTTWEQVRDIFHENGLTALSHYLLYGQSEGLVPIPVGGYPGETYTLTTGVDNIPGTEGNDTIIAGEVNGLQTLTAGDQINGAGGVNTIDVSANAGHNYAGFTMQNVQTMNVTADGGAQLFDMSGTSDLQQINSVNSTNTVQADHVTTLANIGVTNATTAANMTVHYQDSVVTGTSDAVTLDLNNSNAATVTLGDDTTGTTGIETLTIHTSGAASTLGTLNSQISTLAFTGDQNLKIAADLNDSVKTIDASAATGGLTVGIAATNANDVTFTGGSGDDSLTFTLTGGASSLDAKDVITGGAGSDTLSAHQAGLEAAGAAGHVSQVETITVADQLTGATFRGNYFTDATTFNLASGYAAGSSITNIDTDAQAVQINAGNAGVLTIVDDATSATGDSASVIMGTKDVAANATANVAYTTGELETIHLTSLGDATTTTTQNTLTLSAGLGNVTAMTITGNEDMTLTTVASTKLATVDGSTATGGLDLRNVVYAATGATVTTGSGGDKVNGSIAADTISLGAGQDFAYGTQGADAINLGTDTVRDTLQYSAVNQSNTTGGVDTITNFVSGTDQIDLQQLGTESFNGNYATFGQAQGALTGGGVSSAAFDQSTNTLWVDVDGNGTLDNNDLQVKLDGVTSLSATTDFIYGSLNKITITGPNAVVNGTTATNATGVTTTGPDLITVSDTNLKTATIDALSGNDTLNISTQVLANTTAAGVTNVETFNVQAGIAAGATLTMGAGDFTVNLTADGNANAVVLGVGAQVLNGSADIDIVTLGAASQSVYALGGNDTVIATTDQIAGATVLDGGAGTDVLTVSTLTTPSLTIDSHVSNFETLDLAASLTATAVTLGGNNAFSTLLLGANDTVNATNAQAAAMTTITGGGGTLNLTSTGASDVTGVTFLSGLGATNLSSGDDTLHVNGSLAGKGDIDNLGTITGGAGNDTLVLHSAVGAVGDLDNIRGFETVRLGGAANAITIGNDNVVTTGAILTVDDTAATGALTFDGTAETDGHFVINTAAVAGNTIQGGSLSDTINLNTSALTLDTVNLANSTALNLDNVDTVNGFQAGTDKFDVPVVGAGNATFTVTIASTGAPTFVGDVNAALDAASVVTAQGDVIIVNVTGGTYAGTYAVYDSTAGNHIDATAEVVHLTGTVGNITAADFI